MMFQTSEYLKRWNKWFEYVKPENGSILPWNERMVMFVYINIPTHCFLSFSSPTNFYFFIILMSCRNSNICFVFFVLIFMRSFFCVWLYFFKVNFKKMWKHYDVNNTKRKMCTCKILDPWSKCKKLVKWIRNGSNIQLNINILGLLWIYKLTYWLFISAVLKK